MTKKQEQSAQDGSIAIQAAGDVSLHKHGLELTEVKELVNIFLKSHLPTLRDEAASVARKNANAFLNEFVEQLSKPNQATPEAFSKPDSQACFTTALNGSAEKGDQIDTKLLAETVLRRLEADDESLMKLVSEESVRALTKMGRQHIAFLAFIQYTKNVRHTAVTELSQLENTAAQVLQVIKPGMGLSEPNQEYLVSIGALTINRVSDADQLFSSLQDSYSFFPKTLEDLESTSPALYQLLIEYGDSGAPMVYLTSVGKLIGMLALEKALGKVNLAVWVH